MKTPHAVLSAITEDELRTAVAEMHAVDATGILPGGVVRRIASDLTRFAGVLLSSALPLAQAHVLRAAAFTWAGLPIFQEDEQPVAAAGAGAVARTGAQGT